MVSQVTGIHRSTSMEIFLAWEPRVAGLYRPGRLGFKGLIASLPADFPPECPSSTGPINVPINKLACTRMTYILLIYSPARSAHFWTDGSVLCSA